MHSRASFLWRNVPSDLVICGWVCFCLCGCEPESLAYTEVKRIHERITPTEWGTFQRIVNRLPDGRVPPFPQAVFPPPPNWPPERSLPVGELYDEEKTLRESCWNSERLAPALERHKSLLRELRREKLTNEQFAGLLMTVGAAMCRHQADGVNLPALDEQARPIVDELSQNTAPYQELPPEAQHAVIQQAMWIARRIRADRLRQVPLENIALAKQHAAWIEHALPEEFRTNPTWELHDLLEEQGLPFEELKESGFDEDLRWPQATVPTLRQ